MTLRVTIEINGREIGSVSATLHEHVVDDVYKYRLHMHTSGSTLGRVGTVEHDRKDGASVLASKALDAVDEQYFERGDKNFY